MNQNHNIEDRSMNYIGKNLKALLAKEQLSENELSKRIGIPQQIINRIISGINQNPKLSTITPIANYFKIPLQDLISTNGVEEGHGIIEHSSQIPYLDFQELEELGVDKALTLANRFITVDADRDKNYFATSMYDDSMEPKFSFGSILIFEKDKKAHNGDFCLLAGEDNKYIFRQIMINPMEKKFIKSLNPTYNEFNLMPLSINIYVLATLIQSRTSFSNLEL